MVARNSPHGEPSVASSTTGVWRAQIPSNNKLRSWTVLRGPRLGVGTQIPYVFVGLVESKGVKLFSAPSQRSTKEHVILSRLMLLGREKKANRQAFLKVKSFISSAVERSHVTATRYADVLQVPPAIAKQVCFRDSLQKKNRASDIVPAAQLRIAFSGASQSCVAAENSISRSTVRYIRKAAAHIYTELQAKLVQKTGAMMAATKRATQICHSRHTLFSSSTALTNL